MSDHYTVLIGWTIVYVSEGVTWFSPHARGQGNFAGRVFSKSEAEHRLGELEEDGYGGKLVAVYAEPED